MERPGPAFVARSSPRPARGNAVDAAVAALFALTVVEPMMVGLLGGGLAHIRTADGRHAILDGLSTAPAAAVPGAPTALAARANMVGPLAFAVADALAWRGHDVLRVRRVAGGMNAIGWAADGTPVGIAGGLARAGVRFSL